jgi:hypothetical protein
MVLQRRATAYADSAYYLAAEDDRDAACDGRHAGEPKHIGLATGEPILIRLGGNAEQGRRPRFVLRGVSIFRRQD